MQQVLDNLLGLPSAPGAADLDLIFLRGIMESPIVRSLAKVPGGGGHRDPPGPPPMHGGAQGGCGSMRVYGWGVCTGTLACVCMHCAAVWSKVHGCVCLHVCVCRSVVGGVHMCVRAPEGVQMQMRACTCMVVCLHACV